MSPMVVQCSACRTEFELDPSKVPVAGVRARCSVCNSVIVVPARTDTGVLEAPAPASATAPAAGRASEAAPEAAREATSEAASEPAPESASEPAPAAGTIPGATQLGAPADATGVPDERAARTVQSTGYGVPHGVTEGVTPSLAPLAAPTSPPQSPLPASVSVSPSPSGDLNGRLTPPAGVATVAAADHTAVKRSINPFLSKDPSLRAKRLARALVSDIVAYHPAKHAEGLREGSLKTLFRDEIKKSYEEYVDQVGREFAESTSHFQDALNDVLAAGRKLF
jgi:predicted Zn finger-like uncharacterized protein